MARQHGQDLVGEVLAVLAGPKGRSDPYPHYERLRGLGPAALGPDGTLLASGYRVCGPCCAITGSARRPNGCCPARDTPTGWTIPRCG